MSRNKIKSPRGTAPVQLLRELTTSNKNAHYQTTGSKSSYFFPEERKPTNVEAHADLLSLASFKGPFSRDSC